MRIAIPYSFDKPADVRREGIGVYASLLVKALLDNVPDLEIEIWTYTFNRENVKLLFKDSFDKYADKIKIYDDGMKCKNSFRTIMFFCKYFVLKRTFYKVLYLITRSHFYKEKLDKLKSKKENGDWLPIKYRKNKIQEKIKLLSHAEAVYCFFVTMEMGLWFECPKFVQVHDLFTIALKDVFTKHWDSNSVEMHNKIVLGLLEKYAKQGAVFVSSSEYMAYQHSLKFIPGIHDNQVAVIPFPPLIKDFDTADILNEKEFKDKYNIPGKYIAMPSQNRPNKNWGVILRSLAELKKQGVCLYFVTTGHVGDIQYDGQLVKDLGIADLIIEVGSLSQKDLYALYKYSSIVVASTIIEGMGISGQAIEALKVGGVPIIHARSFGIDESLHAVGLTQETADLNWFDLDDYKTLVEKIKDVLSNPQPHIEKQRHVLAAYLKRTWKDVANGYMNLFAAKKGKCYEKDND